MRKGDMVNVMLEILERISLGIGSDIYTGNESPRFYKWL